MLMNNHKKNLLIVKDNQENQENRRENLFQPKAKFY